MNVVGNSKFAFSINIQTQTQRKLGKVMIGKWPQQI